jgi:hypothetical protein
MSSEKVALDSIATAGTFNHFQKLLGRAILDKLVANC